ncbi:MAG: glycine cleavage system protein H [Candidatus Melainabacteria bacterium]|nr:glycine cleavage system protein H [Candidatus Melainabacteria bacterium]
MQYFKTHEWIQDMGEGKFHMGISKYACDQLGDIVFIEEKDEGEEYDEGDSLAILESVKAVGDIYAPFKAKLSTSNKELVESPESLEATTWLVEIEALDSINFDDLETMNGAEYEEYLESL